MPFISFEGGEGSGKTTVISHIKERLEQAGKTVLVTREPGGVKLAEKIRSLLLDGDKDIDAKTEVLLFAAARREHWVERIKPALEDGVIVLCDRFIDSTAVYQGYVGGESLEVIQYINDYVTDKTPPDLTFYLDVDPNIGLQRIEVNDGREKNRIDLKDIQFHLMVQKGYRELCKQQLDRIEWVNANQTIQEVDQKVWEKLRLKL